MTGRFYMVPAVATAAGLSSLRLSGKRLVPIAGLLGLLGLLGLPATLLSGPSYENKTIARSGIADERGYWFQTGGLVADGAAGFDYQPWSAPSDRKVVALCGGLGRYGLDSGSGTHLIDTCGLADPLLSRVPAIPNPAWRIGHFVRAVPLGYQQSIEADGNAIPDRQLHRYYDSIRLVTRSSDLFAPARLAAIWNLNTGILKPGSSYAVDPAVYG